MSHPIDDENRKALFCIDEHFYLLDADLQAEVLCHQSRAQLLGRPIGDVFSPLADSLFYLHAQEAFQHHQMRTYTAFSPSLACSITVRLSPLGPALAIFVQTKPSHHQMGEEQGTSTTFVQSVLDSLQMTIAVLDANGMITAVNDAWKRMATGACSPDQQERTGIGMNYLHICQNAQETTAQEAFAGITAVLAGTQSSFALEYPCFSPMKQQWYLMQVTPLVGQHGAVVAHLDITERKQAEEALQEANRRYDVFLSLASHELRTPLAGIRGNMQLALRRLEKIPSSLDEATMERLRHPLEEAVHRTIVQDRMIADMLDVSRIQAGQLMMVLRPCNLVEIVRRAVEDQQYLAPDRYIALHEPGEQWIPILADADRLGQAISNYLSNALKYSAVDRPVDLWLTKEGTVIRVSVKDEGCGLTSQQQQRLWHCFHRVKGIEVQYGTEGGLGLGLYLCRTIVEAHGGQVGLHSARGQGSTFWFSLPLAQ